MTPSRGTLRWTLTGPGAGGGSGAAAIRAPRSVARPAAGMGLGRVLARTPSLMTWIRCPSSRSVTRRRASSAPILTRCPARSAIPLPSTVRSTSMTVPPGRAPALAGAGAAGGGPAGRGAAHLQRGQVLGVQAGRHGLDQLAADEHVHGELIGPHVGELPGPGRAHLDPLDRGDHAEHAAGRDHRVELDGPRRLGAEQHAAPARRLRALAAGTGAARAGSGWVPGPEQAGGRGHAQRLVRPGVVIGVHPGGDRGLRRGQVGERPGHVEQLAAQRLVPPFHLPGRGRRVRLGELGGDAVLAADPLEQHLGRAGLGEPAGELLAVVGQHLRRDPVAACIAAVNASATARADGTASTAAQTTNREWSSMPDSTLHSRPSAR